MNKDQRKKKVLDIILKTHIDMAEPVGSKYISNILGLSSATIRNIMSELEDDGYIIQPHVSAGRIPTERAYRHYVNSLIEAWESNIEEIRRINRELLLKYNTYTDLIDHASYTVSRLTHYTAFVVYPMDHIHMDGTSNIMEQPEFSDPKNLKKILKTLDNRERLLEVMNSYLSSGTLKIHIGRENSLDGFEECSVITACYKSRNRVVGGVGIIGPIRMKYRRVVPLVRHLADSISRVLERA